MSKVLYAALGDDLDKAFQDGTHHNAYGSYQLAKCVVQGIRENVPEGTEELNLKAFDEGRRLYWEVIGVQGAAKK